MPRKRVLTNRLVVTVIDPRLDARKYPTATVMTDIGALSIKAVGLNEVVLTHLGEAFLSINRISYELHARYEFFAPTDGRAGGWYRKNGDVYLRRVGLADEPTATAWGRVLEVLPVAIAAFVANDTRCLIRGELAAQQSAHADLLEKAAELQLQLRAANEAISDLKRQLA